MSEKTKTKIYEATITDSDGREILVTGTVSSGRSETYGQPKEYPEADIHTAVWGDTERIIDGYVFCGVRKIARKALIEAASDATEEERDAKGDAEYERRRGN